VTHPTWTLQELYALAYLERLREPTVPLAGPHRPAQGVPAARQPETTRA
jgi:hypothetical protein